MGPLTPSSKNIITLVKQKYMYINRWGCEVCGVSVWEAPARVPFKVFSGMY